MNTLKKLTLVVALLSFSSLMLVGCSDDQKKKAEKKGVTTQEQMGKDAAESIKKPIETAKKTTEEASNKADQALKAVTDETKKAAPRKQVNPSARPAARRRKSWKDADRST